MDLTLRSLEPKAGAVQPESRAGNEQLMANLRGSRDAFRSTIEAQAQPDEASWARVECQLEAEWERFQADANAYIERFGGRLEQQLALFKNLMGAQLNAWRKMADQFATAKEFVADRRQDINAAAARIKADAGAAEQEFQKNGPRGQRILVRAQHRVGGNARRVRSCQSEGARRLQVSRSASRFHV
jgi:hypothetical protein